jgi:hypothetical protein
MDLHLCDGDPRSSQRCVGGIHLLISLAVTEEVQEQAQLEASPEVRTAALTSQSAEVRIVWPYPGDIKKGGEAALASPPMLVPGIQVNLPDC